MIELGVQSNPANSSLHHGIGLLLSLALFLSWVLPNLLANGALDASGLRDPYALTDTAIVIFIYILRALCAYILFTGTIAIVQVLRFKKATALGRRSLAMAVAILLSAMATAVFLLWSIFPVIGLFAFGLAGGMVAPKLATVLFPMILAVLHVALAVLIILVPADIFLRRSPRIRQ